MFGRAGQAQTVHAEVECCLEETDDHVSGPVMTMALEMNPIEREGWEDPIEQPVGVVCMINTLNLIFKMCECMH
jgi:hypothetical protein